MKKYFSFVLFIVIGSLISPNLCAQKDTVINGIHYKADRKKNVEYSKNHKRLIPIDSEFVINNKRFRYYNNWVTIGGGIQQNLTYGRKAGFTGGGDFNFHIKRNYFQVGLELSGERVSYYQNYQVHLGCGMRKEDKDVQVAGFIGPSFSSGVGLVGDTVYTRKYYEPGIYFQGDVIKKIAQDVGIGASLYIDWNQEQTMAGLRAVLYFSSSYKGKKWHEYEPAE